MASPITVTANLIDLTGNAISGYMQAALVSPTGVYDLYIANTGIIAPKLITSSIGTTVSVQVWGNDVVVDMADSKEDTYYTVTLFNTSNVAVWVASYTFTGSSPVNLVGYPSLTVVPVGTPTTQGPPGPAGPPGPEGTAGSNSGVVSGGNVTVKGPSPWIDVTAYGAVARSSFETTTATTNGTTAVALSSAIDFVDGDGIVIWKAGSATSQSSPPSAPSVVCAAVTGSQTFNYKCVGYDAKGGLTAASTLGHCTNAPSVFGNLPVSVTGVSESSGTVTYTTSVGLGGSMGQMVAISGLTGVDSNGTSFNGIYPIASISGTSFTVTFGAGGSTGTGSTNANSYVRLCNSYLIDSITRSGTTISITTNADHNFGVQSGGFGAYSRTIAIVQGIDQAQNLSGTADLNGQYVILTASGTSLTLDSAISSTETGITTGVYPLQPTVTVWEYITVTCPAIAGSTVGYYVYGDRGTGTYSLLGKTLPFQRTFIDWGQYQAPDYVAPAYVPATPPAAVQAQMYAGYIVSGAGTTSIVVSPSVPGSVTNTAMHDESYAIGLAMTVANTVSGGTVFVPFSSGKYIINAPLSVPYACSVLVDGDMVINETIDCSNASAVGGFSGVNWMTSTTGAVNSPIRTSVTGIASPMIMSVNNYVGVTFNSLEFQGTYGSGQTYIYTAETGAFNTTFNNVAAYVGNAEMTGTSIPVVIGGYSGYQLCPHFLDCGFIGYTSGVGNGSNGLNTAVINLGPNIPVIKLMAGEDGSIGPQGLLMEGVNTFWGRGILLDGTFGQMPTQASISIYEFEAPTTPAVMLYGTEMPLNPILCEHFELDSQPGCALANWTSTGAGTGIYFVTIDDCHTSGPNSLLTGSAIPGLIVKNSASPVGQNFSVQSLQIGSYQETAQYQGVPFILGSTNIPIAWQFPKITGITLATGVGAVSPAATYQVWVTPVGWNNLEGQPNQNPPSIAVNGSQGIQVNWTALAGVKGYNVYVGGYFGNATRINSSPVTTNSLLVAAIVNNANLVLGIDQTGLPLIDQNQVTTPLVRLPSSAGLGYITLQSLTTTLTSTQIKALHASPISLLAAPGTGLMYVINNVCAHYRYATAAYTLNSAVSLTMGFTSTPLTYPLWTVAALSGFATATSDVFSTGVATGGNIATADAVDAAVYISNDTANLSVGGGTITLAINYSIIDTTKV